MNVNTDLWPVHSFVDGLVRAGVTQVVISPGSRNTPLVIAFVEHPAIKVYTHMDERSAAFFALGLARGNGRPVVIACTSGTAVANYYPAIMEAFEARVPLIVVTADRPPTLRDVGANQAVRQTGVYASHVKWSVEMPIPDGLEPTARHAASVAARVYAVAVSAPAGPVHLNYPFVEPLMPPSRDDARLATIRTPVIHGAGSTSIDHQVIEQLDQSFQSARRPLIVVGPQFDPMLADKILQFAIRNQIPVMADALSQLRSRALDDALHISHYDLLLSTLPSNDRFPRPDFVLRFGAEPTSKSLSAFLQSLPLECRVWLVDEAAMYRDASLVATDVVVTDVSPWLNDTVRDVSSEQIEYIQAWDEAENLVAHVVADKLQSGWVETHAIHRLTTYLGADAQLFIGNSRPVRDLDALMTQSNRQFRVFANRGVSGIDGIVSTAFGVAASHPDGHTVLCIGDVSFYHDLNGLLAANRFGLSLTIVLVHNQGGGIFQHLSQANRTDTLDYFTTPHELEFRDIVSAYGGHYQQVGDIDAFAQALEAAATWRGLRVIEARFDNHASSIWYQSLRAELRKALVALDGK